MSRNAPVEVVELAALLNVDRLRNCDLDVIDMVAVPQWLEHAVGEAQHHDVLNRFLTEIVVDPVDLAFGEHAKEFPVEILGRAQIGTEWLFDDYPSPVSIFFPQQAGVAKPLGDDSERLRRRCKVEQIVAAGVLGLIGLGQDRVSLS